MNGMASNEDHDAFSDDDFSNIPIDELQRLEQDAITFTQQEWVHINSQQDKTVSHPSSALGSKDRASISRGYGLHNGIAQVNKPENLHRDSLDATIFDEDGLPLVVEEQPPTRIRRHLDESAQREQWRVNRFAQPQTHTASRSALQRQHAVQSSVRSLPQQNHSLESNTTRQLSTQKDRAANSVQRNLEEDALRAKIGELVRERDQLTTTLHDAQQEVFARRGEAANIRAKLANAETTYQRQIAALERMKQDDSEKHAALIKAMNVENAEAVSQIQFLKQDLKEEERKAQAYEKQLKDRSLAKKPSNHNTTPKRNHALRDGFDDDEILAVSPVKSGRRSNKGTPTANRKRKHPSDTNANVQSLPLRLSGKDNDNEPHDQQALPQTANIRANVRKDYVTQRHLHLIQKITSFRPASGREVLMERLFKLAFPSDPGRSLGSVVVDAMARLAGERLPSELIQIFIDLWSRALNEQYYACLPLLIETISFCLDHDPFAIDIRMLDSFLPILQSTVEVNAVIRFKLMQKEYLNTPDQPKPAINQNINNTACLELLYTIACLVSDDNELLDRFWRRISTDFALMSLNSSQTIPDITLMLRICATSILPDTFGMICDVSLQSKFETYLCDRVCYLLWDPMKPDVDRPSYSQKEICLLRQECLDFLTELTLGSAPNPLDPSTATNHGTAFVANDQNTIPRLVRCAYNELATAYHMTPTQKLHTQLVNTAVRLLHFVFLSPAGREIDREAKLRSMNGVPHKFRVLMARLAYADGTDPGIDAGIHEDTVRMAIELIESIGGDLPPDEAADIDSIFDSESGGSTKRTSSVGLTQH